MKNTIKPIKKMSTGGASKNPCPGINKCWDGKKCIDCSSAVAGIATSVSGAAAIAGKIISDFTKKRKAVKTEAKNIRAANPDMTKRESRKAAKNKINNPVPQQKRGGSVKSKKK
jgi:hypothetical protein